MKTFFAKWIDRLFALFGAFFFCQLPLLIHQYFLLLAGHRQESAMQLMELEKQAKASHFTLSGYIEKFLSLSDPDCVQMGQWIQTLQERSEALNRAYSALQEANIWTKPFVFLAHLDRAIFSESLEHFSPGVPATLEAAVYALVGVCLGIGLYRLLQGFCRAIVSKFRPEKK